MAGTINGTSSATASTRLADNIAKIAAPSLIAQLNLLKDVLAKVEVKQQADHGLATEAAESFEVVIGDAGAERTGEEIQGLDVVTENQVFEVIISGIHAELEALSGLVGKAGPDGSDTGSASAPGETQIEQRLGEIESLRAILELFVTDESEMKLSDILASLRIDKDLERFGVTADVIKESLNGFLSVQAEQVEAVKVEEHPNTPQATPTALVEVQALDTDWIHAEAELAPRPDRQMLHHNKAFRDFLIRDTIKNTSKLAGPLLRLNKANLSGALIKPFSGLLDVMLNAAMAIPAPLLLVMAYIAMGTSNWRGALRYLQPALPMSRKASPKSRSYEILILQAIGTCHEQLNETEPALSHLTECLDLALVTPAAIYGGPVAVTCAANILRTLEIYHRTDEAVEFYNMYYDRCMSHMNNPPPETPRMPFMDSAKEAAAQWMERNRYPLLVCLGRQEEAMEVMRGQLRNKDVKRDDWECCRIQVDLADLLCRPGMIGDRDEAQIKEARTLLSAARERVVKSKKIQDCCKVTVLRDIAVLTLLGLEDAATAEKDFIRYAELQDDEMALLEKADMQFRLGVCQEALGEPAKAAETFRKAAELYPRVSQLPEGTRSCWVLLAEARAHIAAGGRNEAEIRGLLLRLEDDMYRHRVDFWPSKLLAYSFFYLGEMAQGLGLREEASKEFHQALGYIDAHKRFYRGTLRGRQVFEAMILRRKLVPRLLEPVVSEDDETSLESGTEE